MRAVVTRWPARASALVGAVLALPWLPALATTFAPSPVIQCPGTEDVRRVMRLSSGNTFGALIWSDGFMLAPGMPDLPQITRCGDSGPIFWVDTARVLGTVSFWAEGGDARWQHAPLARALKGEELLDALAQGLGDTAERERYLRLRAWWAANAQFRQSAVPPGAPSTSDFAPGSKARANLEALTMLFDESVPSERLMKVEALRELARFDEARALLPAEPPQEAGLRVRWTLLKERLAARDARVAPLPAPR